MSVSIRMCVHVFVLQVSNIRIRLQVYYILCMYVAHLRTYVFLSSGVNYCYTLRTTGHGWCAQTRHLAAKATWLY